MNILFLVSSLSFGGAEKQAIIDANLLSRDNTVFLASFFDGPKLKLINKRVNYIRIFKGGYLKTSKILAEICIESEIDIVHASLFAPCIISALSSVISKVPTIWHIHSHEYDSPLPSRLAFRFLAKLHSVRKILFVNHELLGHFSIYNFPKAKQGVLYNHSILNSTLVQSKKKQKMVL